MARPHILFDKTEIVVMFMQGRNVVALNLKFSDIQRIQFDRIEERKLFQKVPSEKITIVSPKAAAPILYTRLKEAKYWDHYKSGLAKFAGNNMITFINNLGPSGSGAEPTG